ncbi:hypothetical protein XELAEV_18005045mg [Xenopus laevis]|uniref:Uncharacterized protein n=1 Tax=Xenopus laevis TaxID=8355 RepID=A0A974I2V0_XENLA|nr:hypothetical protein XELAEV_18005045mg [Xenopus laevis]
MQPILVYITPSGEFKSDAALDSPLSHINSRGPPLQSATPGPLVPIQKAQPYQHKRFSSSANIYAYCSQKSSTILSMQIKPP